ncbi:MAG: LptE family protein [Pseudomonadota bacterium]
MKKNFLYLQCCIVAAGVLAAGCGYRLARSDNPLLSSMHTIAVPYFKNKTFEPEAEKIFTYAFVNEFVESKRLQVVSEQNADLILRGTVKALVEDTIAYNRDDKALEYRVDVVLDVQVEERASGRVLWKRKNFKHGEEFPVDSNIVFSEASKRIALEKLAADLAERVHDSIIEGF